MAHYDVSRTDDAQQRATALAKRVLQQYTLASSSVRFIQHNAGIVFRVDARDGPFMLKVHRRVGEGPNPAASQLEQGMSWLANMARDTGIVVPTPLPNLAGRYVSEVRWDDGTTVSATLQRWLDGEPLNGDFTLPQLRQLGRLMARLHNHSTEHPVNPVAAPMQHDVLALRDKVATLHSMLVPDVIDRARFAIVDQAAERIMVTMSELGTMPTAWGTVHGDIHHDNVLLVGDEIRLIDWTGIRLAHYCYELGVTLYHIFYQGLAARRALLAGYTEVRALPATDSQALEAMVTYAAFDNLAWNSTVTAQFDAPLFRKNVAQFVDEFCSSLVTGRRFLLLSDD